MKSDDELLRELLTAAENHGRAGDPEHEVGDLEALVYACWGRLTSEQRREIHAELPWDGWLGAGRATKSRPVRPRPD